MKKLVLILLASALAFAGVANAAPVARSADVSLTVTIQGLPGIQISATGATVTVDTAAGTLSIASAVVVQTAPIVISVTSTTAIAAVSATGLSNLAGLFSIGGGAVTTPPTEVPCPATMPTGLGCVTAGASNLGGQMGLGGTVYAVVVPALVTVPVPMSQAGIGVGGFVRLPDTANGFLFDAAPFTVGVAQVGFKATSTYTTPQLFHAPGSTSFTVGTLTITNSWTSVGVSTGSGTILPTPPVSGNISLVSPTYLSALGNLLPVWTTLSIHFIPEPGTLLLLGAGIAGLVVVGRRRR
jgi:hypothetical protein